MSLTLLGWTGIITVAPGLANRGTCSLGSGEFFDVDAPSLSVDLGDLTLVVLVDAGHDLDLVILPHWERPNTVLLSEVTIEGGAHELVSEVTGGGEVSFSGLSSRAGNGFGKGGAYLDVFSFYSTLIKWGGSIL